MTRKEIIKFLVNEERNTWRRYQRANRTYVEKEGEVAEIAYNKREDEAEILDALDVVIAILRYKESEGQK